MTCVYVYYQLRVPLLAEFFLDFCIVAYGTPSHTGWGHTPAPGRRGNSNWDIASPAPSRDSGLGTKLVSYITDVS